MDKINILVDAHVFDGKYQGTRTYIQGLYNFYHDPRFNVFLVSGNKENLKKYFSLPNVQLLQYRFNNKFLRLLYEIPYFVKKNKIDVIHFQYILPLFCKCYKVVTVHDILFKDFPYYFPSLYKIMNNFLFGKSITSADMVLTVSNYSKDRISHYYKDKAGLVRITPNAVGSKVNCENKDFILQKHNLKKYIINVSRFEPRKGQHLILEAFIDLELFKQDYELVLIGHYDLKYKKFIDRMKTLPKEYISKIKILQNISDEEMSILIKHAQLFIYPSYAEGFGIPPLEAAVLQTPVICSNQTAMKDFDFFKDRMFNPHDYKEFLSKINKYLNYSNEDLADIKRSVERKYNWEDISKGYFNFLFSKFSDR